MTIRYRLIHGFTIVLCLGGVGLAAAQPANPRVEVGAQFSALRLSDFDVTSSGLGGRISYDLTSWAAIEAELNFVPKDEFTVGNSALPSEIRYRRRRVDALFGPKLGIRSDRFGAFVKIRPGFTRLSDTGVACAGPICALILLARPVYRSEFAVDLGGVLEVYPSSRVVLRVDLGDTMIRHRSLAPPCQDCSSHNFASRLGVGYRF